MSKIDLTKPDPEEGKKLSSSLAAVTLTYMYNLAVQNKLTDEERLRAALLVAESVRQYVNVFGFVSQEKIDEILEEVRAVSKENLEKMKASGQFDEVKKLVEGGNRGK